MDNRLTNTELTAAHAETIDGIKRARTLANIQRRGERLWEDGYTAEPFAAGLYHVFGPKGQHYMTTCDEVMGYKCDCPAFAEYLTCKHLIGIANMIADEAQADAHDAQEPDRAAFLYDSRAFDALVEQRNFWGRD